MGRRDMSSQASDAIRQVRYGAGWLDLSYTPPIKITHDGEIQQALRLLGYSGYWLRLLDRPTLAAFLDGRTGPERDHPCVVFLSTHCVAVSCDVFCDVFSRGVDIDIWLTAPWYEVKALQRPLQNDRLILPAVGA